MLPQSITRPETLFRTGRRCVLGRWPPQRAWRAAAGRRQVPTCCGVRTAGVDKKRTQQSRAQRTETAGSGMATAGRVSCCRCARLHPESFLAAGLLRFPGSRTIRLSCHAVLQGLQDGDGPTNCGDVVLEGTFDLLHRHENGAEGCHDHCSGNEAGNAVAPFPPAVAGPRPGMRLNLRTWRASARAHLRFHGSPFGPFFGLFFIIASRGCVCIVDVQHCEPGLSEGHSGINSRCSK